MQIRNVLNGTYPNNPKRKLPGFVVTQISRVKDKFASYINTLAQRLAEKLGVSNVSETRVQARQLKGALDGACAVGQAFLGQDLSQVLADVATAARPEVTAATNNAALRVAAQEARVRALLANLARLCTSQTQALLGNLTAMGDPAALASSLSALPAPILATISGAVGAAELSAVASLQGACDAAQGVSNSAASVDYSAMLVKIVNDALAVPTPRVPNPPPSVLKLLNGTCTRLSAVTVERMTDVLIVIKAIQSGLIRRRVTTAGAAVPPSSVTAALPPPLPANKGRRSLLSASKSASSRRLRQQDTTAVSEDLSSEVSSSAAESSTDTTTGGDTTGTGFTSTDGSPTEATTTTATETTAAAPAPAVGPVAAPLDAPAAASPGEATSSTAAEAPPAPTLSFLGPGTNASVSPPPPRPPSPMRPPSPPPSRPPAVILQPVRVGGEGQRLIRPDAPPTVAFRRGSFLTIAPALVASLAPVCAQVTVAANLALGGAVVSAQPVRDFLSNVSASCSDRQLAAQVAQSRIAPLQSRLETLCVDAAVMTNSSLTNNSYALALPRRSEFGRAVRNLNTSCALVTLFGRVDSCTNGAIATLNASALLRQLAPKVKGGPLALLNGTCQGVATLRTLNSCTQGMLLGVGLDVLDTLAPNLLDDALNATVRPVINFVSGICAAGLAYAPNATGAMGQALRDLNATCTTFTALSRLSSPQLLAWLKQQTAADRVNGPLGPLTGTCAAMQRLTPADVKAMVSTFIQENKRRLVASSLRQAWSLFVAQVTTLIQGRPYAPLVRTAMGFAGGQLEENLNAPPPSPPDPYFKFLGTGGKCRKNHYGPVVRRASGNAEMGWS